ncbi:RNA-guided endonuclease InsQ/TnpB family protein [Acidithiobacillus concretivorus]|uniref:IS200/IS605 family element transposase accessory protein TnpB n=1 Tax=Acidithiobacillus concretivorus TaxID=3063952 RepID=A0ABS5ZQ95_9PROT|nr:transposase [Acidithiobacillus concretivorus]MBU2738687.1 IS200/IS605 family element transposase accessory protein TnpB [Acidithiobacillus concretivorus]
MRIQKAVRYRLDPTPEQESLLSRAAGCVRFVWNRALAIQKSYLDSGCGILNFADLCRVLTTWRNGESFNFLAESPSQPQQQVLRNLDRAFKDAFNPANPKRFPVFKKKGRNYSLRYPDPEQIKLDLHSRDADGRHRFPRIFLPKIGWVKFRKSCPVGGEIRNATVRRIAGHWTVSIQIEREIFPQAPQGEAVGLDLGVREFAALSDGTFVEPIHAYRQWGARLARAQQSMSRKVRFSHNWQKARIKVQRIHRKIAAIREDFLHKTSTRLCKSHAVLVIEDLEVQSMSASAAGTVEQPGMLVQVQSRFNKAILDQGWYTFRRMLEYKTEWHGVLLRVLSPEGTSTTCPECGHAAEANRPGLRKWFQCVRCGHREHSGTVAARNLLKRAGHARLACSAA